MILRLGAALLVAASWAGAPLRAAEGAASIADFVGVWRGVEVTAADGGPVSFGLTAEDLGMTIAPDGDGFRMTWTRPEGGERAEVAFAPTDRPGVFFARPGGNPLHGLFSSPAAGNPLEGERLLWSRLEGDTLVVYNLKLHEDGNFYLHRYAWTLTGDGDGLALDFSRLAEGMTKRALTGRLERVAGG